MPGSGLFRVPQEWNARKARQCWVGARPLLQSPGIVLVISFGERRAGRHQAGSGRAFR